MLYLLFAFCKHHLLLILSRSFLLFDLYSRQPLFIQRGTYGVVTSVKVQLHENIPFYLWGYNATTQSNMVASIPNLTKEEQDDLTNKVFNYCNANFQLDFLFNPERLNVTRDDSNRCGWPELDSFVPTL